MMNSLVRVLDRVKAQQGQALAEYSLILAFVAAASVLALGALGLAIAGHIDAFTGAFF